MDIWKSLSGVQNLMLKWKLNKTSWVWKELINIFLKKLKRYRWPLNNVGLNCTGPVTCRIFSTNPYYSTTWSKVGWIRGCETADMEEWQIGRADCKVILWFSTMWRMGTPNPHFVWGTNCIWLCMKLVHCVSVFQNNTLLSKLIYYIVTQFPKSSHRMCIWVNENPHYL